MLTDFYIFVLNSDIFDNEQLFLVFEFENAGAALECFPVVNLNIFFLYVQRNFFLSIYLFFSFFF